MSDALSRGLSRAVAVLAFLAAGYHWAFGGAYTLHDLSNLEGRVRARATDVAAAEAELDSVRAWADSLVSSPWVIERVARERYGFIRPGELLVRFVDMNGEGGPPDPISEN